MTTEGARSPEDLMRRAIALARESIDLGGGPFGAVVARRGLVVAEGRNGVLRDLDPTAHAEVVAVRAACRALGRVDLGGCDVYASCEPCPMCLGALQWARIDRVFFASDRFDAARAGFDDALFHGALALPPERRRPPMLRLLEGEGRPVLEAWTRRPDRALY